MIGTVDPGTLSEAAATDSICNGVRLRTRIIPAQLFTRVVFVAAATLRVLYTDGVIERERNPSTVQCFRQRVIE